MKSVHMQTQSQRKSKRAAAPQSSRAGSSTDSAYVGQTHRARRAVRMKSVQPERCAAWRATQPAAPRSVV